MRKIIRLIIASLIFSLIILPNVILAQPTTTYQLEGLQKGAKIFRDKWGVSHIYGQTDEDLFFAQGFNAARDRLWQLDLWRRQGEGKLAEAFGERFLEKDKAARLFLYRGDLEKELKSYHPDGEEILSSFVNGINSYVDIVKKNPDLLPLEFKITGSTPGYWTVRSPLIRIFGLTRNLTRELALAQLVY